MMRRFYAIAAILLAFVISGCGTVGRSLVAKQEWSENYAALEGVEATSPLMVDGQRSTIGETEIPTGGRGSTEFSEAVVKLPEEKSIRKVVIYTPNIESFSLYAGGRDEDQWKPLGEVKNNDEKMITMNVSTTTDRIRVRVRETSDDELLPGGRGRRNRVDRAKGKIQEIEIYGLVEEAPAEVAEEAAVPGAPGVSAASEEKPKAPPAVISLQSPQSTYALAGPIPVKIDLKIGPDDLVVLADSVSDEMLRVKLLVKNAAGEKITCSKPTPRVSNPRPYRGVGRPVNVRDARTLEAESTLTVDVPNLLDYYPIKAPGNYTVQLDLQLEHHDNFVGRSQTQIADIERTIREVSSRSNYTQTERASIIQGLKEEIAQWEKRKDSRYLVVGRKGTLLDLSSNALELVIQ
jgi:hypothetical protein